MNKSDRNLNTTLFTEIDICSKEADHVMELIKKSFPNECVILIEKINNPILKERYEHCLKELKLLRGENNVKEMELFHGTDRKSVENIAQKGFMTKYSKVSAYGKGTYFAKDYSYSRNYSINKSLSSGLKLFNNYDTFIIAKVILGVPTITAAGQLTDTLLYDYSCDKLKNPTIFSIPYDEAAYPEYAVLFYSKAEKYF
jgi:hypothetical protein